MSKIATSLALDWSEIFLLVSGLLVAIGVWGEQTKSRWKKWVRTFEVLVVLGVAGELIADGAVFVFSRHLQAISDAEVVSAETRLGTDEKIAATLQQDNLKLKGSLAVEERATSEARKEAAKAELELAKLKAPRSLSEAQQRRLVSELKPFAGTPALITFEYLDPEPRNLAMQLYTVLAKAKWKVDLDPFGAGGYPSNPSKVTTIPGITISRFRGLKLGSGAIVQWNFAKAAQALSDGLRELGLLNKTPGIVEVTDNPNTKVTIIVGKKLL
jgi:hypothetical protein